MQGPPYADAITGEDVVHWLRAVRGPRGQDHTRQRLLLALWGGHDSRRDLGELVELLAARLVEHYRRQDLAPPKPETLRRYARMWLAERWHPQHCPDCAATGRRGAYGADPGQTEACPACRGQGGIPPSGEERAGRFGCSPIAWRDKHAERYGRMVAWLEWEEAQGLAQVRAARRRQ
jgi:hypothetical protein